MSIGYLVGEEAPVVWRGLMVMKALRQLLVEVEWGGLDILVLDLPPGTGDIPLSITQQIVLDGTLPPPLSPLSLLPGRDAGVGAHAMHTIYSLTLRRGGTQAR